jgi:hypothetical protein
VLDEVSSDWKGRREQIIRLQDQVKALKAAQVGYWVRHGLSWHHQQVSSRQSIT